MNQVHGIVTPEAVVLDLETAGVGSRLVAAGIDTIIRTLLILGLVTGTVVIGRVVPWLGIAGVFVSIFLVLVAYPVLFETLWRGQTPGKAMLGLRVVTAEGAPIRFRHAAIRGLLAFVDIYLTSGSVAVLSILFTSRNQRIGDIVAGTLVLRGRTGAGVPTAVTFSVPPGYEGYAATIDVSGLSAVEYGAVRSFLLRTPTLQPLQRYELARQLATPLLARLRHAPPSWVGPEAFLACVAANYQYRQRSAWPPPAWTYPPPATPAPGAPSQVPAPAVPPPAVPPPAVPPPEPTGRFQPPP